MSGQPERGSNPFVWMDCTELEVIDPAGEPSNLIIKTTDGFQLSTRFQLGGSFASWIVEQGVSYTIHYYYEGMGAAAEGELSVIERETVAGQLEYGPPETTLEVLPGTLAPGIYKLTVLVSFEGSPPMTGFFEGPMIQVFP